MDRTENIKKLHRKAEFYDANDMEYSDSLKNDIVDEGLGVISDMLSIEKLRNGLVVGGKMNEAARQMVMDKYGLSFDKPLESLNTLLPLAKKRAEQIKKNAEQIHYDMAYFDLCEMLWGKYKENNNLEYKRKTSYFRPTIEKMEKWTIKEFSNHFSSHIDKMICIDMRQKPKRFDVLMNDLWVYTARLNHLALDSIMDK